MVQFRSNKIAPKRPNLELAIRKTINTPLYCPTTNTRAGYKLTPLVDTNLNCDASIKHSCTYSATSPPRKAHPWDRQNVTNRPLPSFYVPDTFFCLPHTELSLDRLFILSHSMEDSYKMERRGF